MSLQKAFLVLGTALFFAGLVTGLLTGVMANPRMGLSAHMQGITNGVFLLAVGAAWRCVSLGPKTARLTFWLLAFGTVVNWTSTTLAAFWNTGDMTPIHGPAPTASAWQEVIVSTGLLSLTLAMLAGTGLLLFGFLKHRARDT